MKEYGKYRIIWIKEAVEKFLECGNVTIEAKNEKDGGAVFTVMLPVKKG